MNKSTAEFLDNFGLTLLGIGLTSVGVGLFIAGGQAFLSAPEVKISAWVWFFRDFAVIAGLAGCVLRALSSGLDALRKSREFAEAYGEALRRIGK